MCIIYIHTVTRAYVQEGGGRVKGEGEEAGAARDPPELSHAASDVSFSLARSACGVVVANGV